MCSGDPGRRRLLSFSRPSKLTLSTRGNETEVALIGYFHAQQISIAGVARLAEFSIGGSVVAIVAQSLVYNEVVNLLVEDAGTDETDTFEIIFTTQIEVIGECRLQFRITEGNLVVAALLGACNGVGERSAYLEVIVYIIFHQDGGKYIQVTVRFVGRAGCFLFICIELATGIFHMCIFQT